MAAKRKPPRPQRPDAERPKAVREPVQVYLGRGERAMLDRTAAQTGLSRAEVLRRGLRAFAARHQGRDGPMERFMRELTATPWPADTPTDLGLNHDKYLAEIYMDTHEDAVVPPRPKRRRAR